MGAPRRRELLFADLYVEHRQQPACQLRVRLYADWLVSWGRDPLDRRCIDPPMVRRAVRLALMRGWDPDADIPPFWMEVSDVPFLQTPRHLLYAAPLIARVTVRDAEDAAPGCSTATLKPVEWLRGHVPGALTVHIKQPAEQLPRDALAFLHPDPERPEQFAGWPWYGALFRVSRGAALLYDDSGEERRWRFRPLRIIREELIRVCVPMLVPEGVDRDPIEE